MRAFVVRDPNGYHVAINETMAYGRAVIYDMIDTKHSQRDWIAAVGDLSRRRGIMSRNRALSIVCLFTLSLTLAATRVAQEVQVPLDYNFNGMTHPGESGMPDAPDGFRSISDRSLDVDGGPMAFGDLESPGSGLSYDVVDVAGELDILHLGNRDIVDNGNCVTERGYLAQGLP